MIELALKIATKAHKRQKDKAGIDYIQHPIAVASMVSSKEEKIVALLHDLIEDTDITIEDLVSYGFSREITDAVELITKSEDLDYETYIKKIKSISLAKAVKIADLTHNSDLTRLNNITNEDLLRVEKYEKAIKYLMEE